MHFSKHPGLPPSFLRKELFFLDAFRAEALKKKIITCISLRIVTKLKVTLSFSNQLIKRLLLLSILEVKQR